MKKKVNVYIDGFNLYHSLKKLGRKYKWINLRRLVNNYIDTETQEIKRIYFFTALPVWNKKKVQRHKKYIKALLTENIIIRYGKFTKVQRIYEKRHNKLIEFILGNKILQFLEKIIGDKIIPQMLKYGTHEEKRTDVNIVLQIFEDAVKDNFDDAMIISGDSDIIPVIKSVKNTVEGKRFISLLPIRGKGKDIKKSCDIVEHMKKQDLDSSFFPRNLNYGGENIVSPYIN